jgi:antitoxin HicB
MEEGIHAEVNSAAVKRVLASQLDQAMKEQHLSKAEMARRMDTSRPKVDRLLDPDNPSVTLDTLSEAARAVGLELRVELV